MNEHEELEALFKRFATRIAKEMRAPINNIVGLLDFTIAESDNPDVTSCLDAARASADTLQLLVNELLDFSDISSGKKELEHYPEDLPVWLSHTTRFHKTLATQHSQELSITIADGVPSPIIADWKKMSQVVSQLLQNCIEYSPQHEVVELKVSASDGESGEEQKSTLLHFTFTDKGTTFTPSERKALLKVTQFDDGKRDRRKSGTFGLGMTIATSLIDSLGGSFEAQTPETGGNQFFVSIPVQKARF